MLTQKELKDAYGCSRETMRKRLREIGFEPNKRRFTPSDVSVILEYMGAPELYRPITDELKRQKSSKI